MPDLQKRFKGSDNWLVNHIWFHGFWWIIAALAALTQTRAGFIAAVVIATHIVATSIALKLDKQFLEQPPIHGPRFWIGVVPMLISVLMLWLALMAVKGLLRR